MIFYVHNYLLIFIRNKFMYNLMLAVINVIMNTKFVNVEI